MGEREDVLQILMLPMGGGTGWRRALKRKVLSRLSPRESKGLPTNTQLIT